MVLQVKKGTARAGKVKDMKYKYHVTVIYELEDGVPRLYRGRYKSEKSAKKRIEELHTWFSKVYNEKIIKTEV